eukprot:1161639-Pelagomonas_calceolata.AAC.8
MDRPLAKKAVSFFWLDTLTYRARLLLTLSIKDAYLVLYLKAAEQHSMQQCMHCSAFMLCNERCSRTLCACLNSLMQCMDPSIECLSAQGQAGNRQLEQAGVSALGRQYSSDRDRSAGRVPGVLWDWVKGYGLHHFELCCPSAGRGGSHGILQEEEYSGTTSGRASITQIFAYTLKPTGSCTLPVLWQFSKTIPRKVRAWAQTRIKSNAGLKSGLPKHAHMW